MSDIGRAIFTKLLLNIFESFLLVIQEVKRRIALERSLLKIQICLVKVIILSPIPLPKFSYGTP